MVLGPLRRRRAPEPAPRLAVTPAVPEFTMPQRQLRVVHFSDTYLPRRDGIITWLQTLTGSLSELGHDSRVVIPRHPDQDEEDHLMRLRSLPLGIANFRLSSWPRLRHVEEVARWRPNVVHVHTPGPVGLLGVFAARRLGLPLVQTYHTDLHAYADAYKIPTRILSSAVRAASVRVGCPTPRLPGVLPGRSRRAERRRQAVDAAIEVFYGDSDALLVPTPAILNRCTLPVDDDRVYVVPAGVALPASPGDARREFRAEYGIGESERVVLFIGRVNREKGIDLLTEAFGRVAGRVPACRLLLVGAVYDRPWVRQLLDEAGIADRTVLTGELPRTEVARACAASDVFAFPSRTDTQGLVVQEASLAGLAPALVDAELHSSGPLAGAGLLAEPTPDGYADSLAALLTDDELRIRVASEARELANRNSPASFASRMSEVYDQAIRAGATANRLQRRRRFWRTGQRRLAG